MSTSTNQPEFEVFVIRDSKDGGKSYWTKIGAGFRNKDGSVNLDLAAIPVDGRCQLRKRETKADREERRNRNDNRNHSDNRGPNNTGDRYRAA